MFHELGEYLWALSNHWAALVTGGLVSGALTLLERKWKQIHWTRFRWLTLVFLLWATFLEWSDARAQLLKAETHIAASDSATRDAISDVRLWHARADEKEKSNDDLRKANDDLRRINGEQALLLNKRPTPFALSVAGGRSPEETAKRRALRSGLSKLLIRGQELMEKCLSADTVTEKMQDDWIATSLKFIQENQTDTSFEARFRSPQPLGALGHIGTPTHNDDIWNTLNERTRALSLLIGELQD